MGSGPHVTSAAFSHNCLEIANGLATQPTPINFFNRFKAFGRDQVYRSPTNQFVATPIENSLEFMIHFKHMSLKIPY